MNPTRIADDALKTLKRDLDASKFTPEEWADVELAVNELAVVTAAVPVAEPAQLPGLKRRGLMARSILRNLSLAKAIEVEGAVLRAIDTAFRELLDVGLASLRKILVG